MKQNNFDLADYNLSVNLTLEFIYAKMSRSSEFFSILESFRNINIITTLLVLTIGLIGNFLTIFVYSKKELRTNSSNVYMLCLAITDNMFLFVHLFEDTLRTLQSVNEKNKIIQLLNLIEKYDLACRIINYLRNVLRLISACIIVAFTVQRLYIVYKPLSDKFKTKNSAWLTFKLITIVSFLVNIWNIFIFELKVDDLKKYCDVNDKWAREYYKINIVYISLIMILPIIIIFISNILIIHKTKQNDTSRSKFKRTAVLEQTVTNFSKIKTNSINLCNNKSYDHFKIKKQSFKLNYSKKITKTLVINSFSYAILNMPYVITWTFFYNEYHFSNASLLANDYVYLALQFTEIFSIFNYGLHFFLFCLSGTLFRRQLIYCAFKLFCRKKSQN